MAAFWVFSFETCWLVGWLVGWLVNRSSYAVRSNPQTVSNTFADSVPWCLIAATSRTQIIDSVMIMTEGSVCSVPKYYSALANKLFRIKSSECELFRIVEGVCDSTWQ